MKELFDKLKKMLIDEGYDLETGAFSEIFKQLSKVVEQPKEDAVNEDLLNKIKDDVAHKFSGKKWEDTPDRFKDIYVNYVILRYLESTITVPSKDNKGIDYSKGDLFDPQICSICKMNIDSIPSPKSEEKKTLICNNCKEYWIAPKDKCDCGCSVLTETHSSNAQFAKSKSVTGDKEDLLEKLNQFPIYNKPYNDWTDNKFTPGIIQYVKLEDVKRLLGEVNK